MQNNKALELTLPEQEQNCSEWGSTSLSFSGFGSQHWPQLLGLFLMFDTESFKIEKFRFNTASPQHVCFTQTLFFKQSLLYLIHYKIWKIVGKQQTQTGATLTSNNSGPFAKLIGLKTKSCSHLWGGRKSVTSVQTTFKISCLTSFECSVLRRAEVLPSPPSKERHETSICKEMRF